MFDGNLFIELLRIRCLYDIAAEIATERQTKHRAWRYILEKTGDVLVTLGRRLKAKAHPPPFHEPIEDTPLG
jgi:hypothetical protein